MFPLPMVTLRSQSPALAHKARNWGSMDWEQPVLMMFPSGSQQSGGPSQDDTEWKTGGPVTIKIRKVGAQDSFVLATMLNFYLPSPFELFNVLNHFVLAHLKNASFALT